MSHSPASRAPGRGVRPLRLVEKPSPGCGGAFSTNGFLCPSWQWRLAGLGRNPVVQSRVVAWAPPGWSPVGHVAGGREYCVQGLQTMPRRSSGRDHRPLGLRSACHRVEALLPGKVCYCCTLLSLPFRVTPHSRACQWPHPRSPRGFQFGTQHNWLSTPLQTT